MHVVQITNPIRKRIAIRNGFRNVIRTFVNRPYTIFSPPARPGCGVLVSGDDQGEVWVYDVSKKTRSKSKKPIKPSQVSVDVKKIYIYTGWPRKNATTLIQSNFKDFASNKTELIFVSLMLDRAFYFPTL